ncbi:MAG: nucleotide sugar dehydrogenase [Actinomycetota bacterium]
MQAADPAPGADGPLAVLGAGHVGLVTAVGFAYHGMTVRVGEADAGRLALLQAGRVPFHEPGLDPLVADAVTSGLLTFHSSNAEAAQGAAAIFLAVPTPADLDGSADLSAVAAAIRSIAPVAVDTTVVVVKSSVPPGSWRRIQGWMEEAGCHGSLVINPEFLQEGRAIEGVLEPTRVVVGSTNRDAAEMVARLHEPFDTAVVVTDPASAELTKYAANSYLAMRVTFANTIANLADLVGADITDVVAGLGLDPRIGAHFLRPGPGYGGSCFPKDVRALIATGIERGLDLGLLQAVVEVNAAQIDRVIAKLADALGPLKGRRIGLLGLAFKADTDDTAESPALLLAEALIAAGASVTAYDPAASCGLAGVVQVGSALEALREADAALIATEWPEFGSLDPAAMAAVMAGTVVVDARNMIDRAAAVAAGLDYRGMGR